MALQSTPGIPSFSYTTPAESILSGDGISDGVLPQTGNIFRYYAFSSGSGSTLVDHSGNNVDGTIINSPSWVSGYDGQGGIQFNGTDQWVDIGAVPSLGDNCTILALTNIDSIPEFGMALSLRTNQNNYLQATEEFDGSLEFKYSTADSGNFYDALTQNVSTGLWELWTGRKRQSDGTAMLFKDDVQEASTSGVGTGDQGFDATDGIAGMDGNSQNFPGTISLVIMWTSDLTDNEIDQLASDLGVI